MKASRPENTAKPSAAPGTAAGDHRTKRAAIGARGWPRRDRLRRDVRIRITYLGSEPGPLLLGKRDELEACLSVENAGTAVRHTVESGAIIIHLVTADAERTREIAWKHVNKLGLAIRTTIHDEPVDPRRGA